MDILYVDESGKSGAHDPQQPDYILGGVIVAEDQWLAIEHYLTTQVDQIVPRPRPADWELHGSSIAHGKKHFKGLPRSDRAALFDAVLDTVDHFNSVLEMVIIDKPKHLAQYKYPSPPEILAFQFMVERLNYYLGRFSPSRLGIIVSDEQKGLEGAIRDAQQSLRQQGSDFAPIENVVETPFFAPSHASCMLQIVDMRTYCCNKFCRAERAGQPVPPAWTRVQPQLDTVNGRIVGLKRFP